MRTTNIYSFSTDNFPSSAAFDHIASALLEESERKDAVKKGAAIFAFTIKNGNGDTADWHIDLKETGKVGKGLAPDGKKANGTNSYTKSNPDVNRQDNPNRTSTESGTSANESVI